MRPLTTGDGLAEDGNGRGTFDIGSGDFAASDKTRAHGFQIMRSHYLVSCGGLLAGRRRRAAF
jgi:hypothetical protein